MFLPVWTVQLWLITGGMGLQCFTRAQHSHSPHPTSTYGRRKYYVYISKRTSLQNFARSSGQLRTNFGPTSHELRANFARTSGQLRTNFGSTSYELRANFAQASHELRANFAQTSGHLRTNRTSGQLRKKFRATSYV